MLKGKTVVLGVTGSIAAYKIANLASSLVKLHADVHVIMTKNATNFINPYIIENHAVEEALNVEEVGGRRESQRAIPNSEGRKPWI